jgi:propionyl-CoA carboxylase beta chain
MSSKHVRGDIVMAYPTAEIAVMGSDGAVNIISRAQIMQAEDPDAERAKLIEEYKERFANPYRAADLGFVDEVIRPEDTRPRVISAFEMLDGKRQTNPPKKHGNIPL